MIARCCNDSEEREEVSGWTNFACSYLHWLDSWEFESYFYGALGKLGNYVNLTLYLKTKWQVYKHKFIMGSVFCY